MKLLDFITISKDRWQSLTNLDLVEILAQIYSTILHLVQNMVSQIQYLWHRLKMSIQPETTAIPLTPRRLRMVVW